jgi:hypothetical protein
MIIRFRSAENGKNGEAFCTKTAEWDIEDADLAVRISAEDGGFIGYFENPQAKSGISNRAYSRGTKHNAIMVIVVCVCIGFLVVLVNDVTLGTLTFRIFMEYVMWALAGLGLAGVSRKITGPSNE